MTLTLTEAAEFRLRTFLQASSKNATSQRGIRVAVDDGGCSGYQYSLNITSVPQANDIVIQQGKLQIYIDAQSAPLLEGVAIDFVDGLLESGFKFSNPNATDTCGCGKSFQAGDCTPAGVPCS
ncbi:iron-sulfur cluster assembly accessory protein [Gloeocapsopsis crepidinum LEGE 06123]|uniref:Iron-sulfur cluster assembly accessory protein n=1 Tax=Gloeocapsopsis crepidinum LEGE 06123 TaxID=588587 RepID=A0ABR9UU78_9CHRO|nr:iron-sulfur cluster assembly accessory protein [Gloeocapsopsis crepidinum]MBE9191842.1 iron-sulfur cluster assembly accessory protein [Gloeocapsopsis crepidinum LEGE 06123]